MYYSFLYICFLYCSLFVVFNRRHRPLNTFVTCRFQVLDNFLWQIKPNVKRTYVFDFTTKINCTVFIISFCLFLHTSHRIFLFRKFLTSYRIAINRISTQGVAGNSSYIHLPICNRSRKLYMMYDRKARLLLLMLYYSIF